MDSEREPRNTDLPPELRAMNAAMDTVFGAGTERPVTQVRTEQLDIEAALMKIPGFDYTLAWELFHAFMARLERVYEERLDPKVAEAVKQLERALAQAEEPDDDPGEGEDERLDDPRHGQAAALNREPR